MITYPVTLDVSGELAHRLARLLTGERHSRGTRTGTQKLTCFWQAALGLRWFRDRTHPDRLGCEHRHFEEVTKIGDDGLTFAMSTAADRRRFGGFDTVALVYGGEAKTALYDRVRGEVSWLHILGDVNAPRRLVTASRQGYVLAKKFLE